MATYYSQGDGDWSTLTNWDTNAGGGGSDPASVADMDDDTFIIQANHTITMDADTSGFANGIAGLTITSHATTPGMLRFKYDADGTYHLKIKTGTTIAGTNAAAKGRLLANSDGVWGNTGALAFGRKAIIDLQGTANISALYLDIALYCTQPTNTYAEVYGTAYVVTCEADDDKVTFVSPSTTPPQAGTPITLSGTLPAELTEGTTYYVRDVSGSTCKLEATIGGGAINLTDDGSGTIYLHYGKWGPVAQSTAVNTTTGVITWDGVPPAAGTAVVVRSSDTLPTGYSVNDCYYVRTVSGNTCKLALQNGDTQIVIPSTVGTGNISMYRGGAATTTAVVNVATHTDVGGDAGWVTTDGHNFAVLVDTFDQAGYDQQRLQVNTIAARYLVLSANMDSAQYPGAQVWLMSRNVAIRSATTTTTSIVDYGVGTHGGVFKCSIRSTAGTGTTFYGYAIVAGVGCTVSGTVSGCTYAISAGTQHTISGTISACSYGINAGTRHIISGTINGCDRGINNSAIPEVSGTISGCNYGIGATSPVLSGVIIGCTQAFPSSTSVKVTPTGWVSGCNFAFNACANLMNEGTIRGCTYSYWNTQNAVIGGILDGSGAITGTGNVLVGPTILRSPTGITAGGSMTRGYGAIILSTTQIATYKHASIASPEGPCGVQVWDLGGVANYFGFWTLGGFTKTAAYAVGTHTAPPIASTFIHEMTFEDNDRVNWVEIPVYGTAGNAVTVTFYGRLTATSLWTTRPNIGIYDPTKGWQTAPEILNASAVMANNTDWQTLTATYTPAHDRELRIRVQGVGGNAGGTGTEKLYWFHTLSLGSGGGSTVIVIED